MSKERHAEGTEEHMLCGLAHDAHETGDWSTPVIPAKAGELVTCEECRSHIDHVHKNFRNYRQQ